MSYSGRPRPPEHTAATLCRPICAPQKAYSAVMQNYKCKPAPASPRSSSLALPRRTPKQLGVQLAYMRIQWHPPLPPFFQPWRCPAATSSKAGTEKAMEDVSGIHRLVSALRSSWPGEHRRIATSRELQLRSSPGPGRCWTAYNSHSLAFSTDRGYNSESVNCRDCYPALKYAGKEAEAGPGGQKKLTQGNIGDWKLLKKMEIKERETGEAMTSRAKAKTRRVTGTGAGAGGVVSVSGAAQKTRVCSTRIFTTF